MKTADLLDYTEIGMEKVQPTSAKTRADFTEQAKALSRRLVDDLEELFGDKAREGQREFERRVESQLRNGAKFIPRKQPAR